MMKELRWMREVAQSAFVTAHRDGALVIDVREVFEYVAGHVPGARLIPMGRLAAHAAELPRDRPVYVICATGNRSLTSTEYLARGGVDAWSVAGGTTRGPRPGHHGEYVAGGLCGENIDPGGFVGHCRRHPELHRPASDLRRCIRPQR
jgi:rhodanese-related sulfurtransferase